MPPDYLTYSAHQPRLAYHYTPPQGEAGAALPTVIFCGGYRSDMTGTKATYLEEQCRARGQAYLRFDYRGHGQSDGEFEDGTIGLWRDDAISIIDWVVKEGDIVLVGSSMGGWIALLCALKRRTRISGVIGIAAAPDFTEELFHERLDEAGQAQLMEEGVAYIPNDYSDEPYAFTRDFYEEAKNHLILGKDQRLTCPLHLIQGREDKDVPWRVATKIGEVFGLDKRDITFVEDGDHRLSRPEDLALIDKYIKEVSGV